MVMKYAMASSEKARQGRTSPGIAVSPSLTLSLRSSEVIVSPIQSGQVLTS
jgi:hypothetical protein